MARWHNRLALRIQISKEPSEISHTSTEGGMIFKRLLKVTDDYYVKSTSVTTKGRHVILDVELYPFEPEPIIRIIEKLEKNQYINALELEQLRKAGMRQVYDREKFLKRPLWPKTRQEIRERLYKIRPYLQGEY
jgi:hypothetical protein